MFDRHRRGSHAQSSPQTAGAAVPGKHTLTAPPTAAIAAGPGKQTLTAPPTAAGPGKQTLTAASPPPGGGSRLPDDLRGMLERAFGLDLGTVGVFVGDVAPAHRAQALARGNELHFAPGAYDPGSAAGRELIGHEVAHLAQQTDGRASGAQGKGGDGDPGLEAEADDLGRRAARGEVNLVGAGADTRRAVRPSSIVQRKPLMWDEIKLNSAGAAKWKPHKTQPDRSDNQQDAITLHGFGAHVEGTADAVKLDNKVTYKSPLVSGGAGFTADVLGPDHLAGAEPDGSWAMPGKLQSVAQKAVVGAKRATPYQEVQLLPAALGGGGDRKNMVALPSDAAKTMRDEVHARLTRLVNTNRVRIWCNVKVTEKPDTKSAATKYAQQIDAAWMELDATGAAQSSTMGNLTIRAPAPSEYGGAGKTSSADAPVNNTSGTANRARIPMVGFQRADGTGVEFATRIRFGDTHDTGDGRLMEATMLGPDHKIGEEPAAKGVWSKRTQELRTAAGTTRDRQSYVAGHLLNHHIGGPGNDSRNLAPIPRDANDLHESEVESHIKRLVNDEKAWVYYRVETKLATDSDGTEYPNAFICNWHQLDQYGEKVANTAGARTIAIKPPSKYKTKDSAARDLGSEKRHGVAQSATARTKLAYDEVLLDDNVTLKHQREVMTPLILKLRELGLHKEFIHDKQLKQTVEAALAGVQPTSAEKNARQAIEKLTGEIISVADDPESIQAALPKLTGALETNLGILIGEVKKRHQGGLAAAKALLERRYERVRAGEMYGSLTKALEADELAVESTVKPAQAVIGFAHKAVGQLSEHRDALLASVGKLRQWIGVDPVPGGTSGSDLGSDLMDTIAQGHEHISEFIEAPMSPMRVQEVGDDVLGRHEDSAVKTKSALIKHQLDLSQPGAAQEQDLSVTSKYKLDAKLFAAMVQHGAKWPSGGSGWFADLVVGLAPVAAIKQEMVQRTLASLYETETETFATYYRWLQTRLTLPGLTD